MSTPVTTGVFSRPRALGRPGAVALDGRRRARRGLAGRRADPRRGPLPGVRRPTRCGRTSGARSWSSSSGTRSLLLLGVGAGTMSLGIALAWLVVFHEFPGRRDLRVGAGPAARPPRLRDRLRLPGRVRVRRTAADRASGHASGQRRASPTSAPAAASILVMTLVLYPYVYTLARAALLEQSPEAFESARSLGRSRVQAFRDVSLPLARPALVAGTTLACMEALADYGTVATFSYRTLTEAVYRVWHGMFDRLAATQLAAVLLGLAALLILLERVSRGRARFTQGRRPTRPARSRAAHGRPRRSPRRGSASACGPWRSAFRSASCSCGRWRILRRDGLPPDFLGALGNSLGLAASAAALTLGVALVLAYAIRFRPARGIAPVVRVAAARLCACPARSSRWACSCRSRRSTTRSPSAARARPRARRRACSSPAPPSPSSTRTSSGSWR